MSSSIILGVKISPGTLKRHKLENYDLNDAVIILKAEAAIAIGHHADNLEVIYHGKILKDDATLLEHGVKEGEMVHILKKLDPQDPTPLSMANEMTIEQLISTIRIFGPIPTSPAWTQALQVVNDPALMEEIITAVPELENDPVSLSILYEPELVAYLRNITLARKLNTERPALIAGAKKLVQIIDRQLSSSRNSNIQNTTASGYSYSLEALSEDEDEDDEELDEYSRMMDTNSGITNQQLAAALRFATRAQNARSAAGRSRGNSDLLQFLQQLPTNSNSNATSAEGSSRTPTGNANRRLITTDMFNSAFTQAISSITTPNNANNTNASRSSTPNPANPQPAETPMNVDPTTNDGSYDNQLQTMREMGLTNERLNIRALLLSDGDVMAAVNLVFNGTIED